MEKRLKILWAKRILARHMVVTRLEIPKNPKVSGNLICLKIHGKVKKSELESKKEKTVSKI